MPTSVKSTRSITHRSLVTPAPSTQADWAGLGQLTHIYADNNPKPFSATQSIGSPAPAEQSKAKQTMAKPIFWSQPFRYMRWASHEKPAIFYSIIMGSLGPVFLLGLPPIRRYFGDEDPTQVPMTYPSMLCLFITYAYPIASL